ncbi:uncharacterized protein LOC126568665 [Anopheles maculipalpis]|uniref:uncharacterized protein LOC126568665 n=1 Tax=Anopheles maculipalpis TaxID=1496333 RepID=UPI002159B062|nr:uncharacterized protein LOC126568665 [Anopheles maculipalpis]
MAKGAKRKTKWVSLSLANANTKTSNAAGSDSEQALPHQTQSYGEGHRFKMLNGTSLASKPSKDLTARTDATEERDGNERTQQDHQSGNRTDTSTGSDCVAGSERRPASSYQRRRPPPYNTRTNWSGGVSTGSSNGRNQFHRNGYYGNGGNGHYGTGKRSHYDNYTRRQQNTASAPNRTTSGDGGEAGRTTAVNDDEYTRITTPRQDVLFKKGYLSRPKPSVATASTSNTGSSSLAGTTSEGSDGGNGGSNSISTTESITSEYGGSYAADGGQLFDYSFPCVPCGYFTENGVLVMNGFAVDNNGFSYFNGGQTYIYPPNYSNCQQSPTVTTTTTGDDQTMDSNMLYANDDMNDETNANESTDLDSSTADHSTPVIETESVPVYNENGGNTASDGQFFSNDGLSSMEQVPLCEVVPEQQIVPNGSEQLNGELVSVGAENETAASTCVQDFSENGYFPYTNGYDFAQFYNSLCYPGWMMDQQYRLYDDAVLPLYCGSEYAMTNEEAYGHQSSYKKRKKRFRMLEEMPSGNGNPSDVGGTTSTIVDESNITGSGNATECVPENHVPSTDVCNQSYQLNADVQEFQPSPIQPDATTIIPNLDPTEPDKNFELSVKINKTAKTQAPAKNRHQAAPKLSKSSSKTMSAGAVVAAAAPPSDDASKVSSVLGSGKPAANKANRKKDLIESTLAFAAQNIDLTRPKAIASEAPSHDSELCWTTIDRNGRKKRIALVPDQEPVTAIETEKQSSGEDRTNEKSTVGDTIQRLEPSTVLQDSSPAAASPSLSVSNDVATDAGGKKEPQTKSKKKTHKHKRQQQLRKSVTNFNKQPLEGFQLIEPEFASAAAGHRRGRSSDKAGRVEPTAQKALGTVVEIVSGSNIKETLPKANLEQSEYRAVDEQPEIMDEKLNCDKLSNGEPPEVSPAEEVVEVEVVEEEVVAQKLVPQLAPASAFGEKGNLNETETENHHQQQQQPTTLAVVEEAQNEEPQAEVVEEEEEVTVIEKEAVIENDIKKVVQTEAVLGEADQENVELNQDSIELVSSSASQEPNVKKQTVSVHDGDKTNELLSPPTFEEQQITNVELSVDTRVFVAVAKQLTISPISLINPTLPALEEDEAEDHVDGADDGIGSEGDDIRTKRGSVSGAGYTESIDSGLQSPAPCGGVASPETSSMVSSIESQPAIDLPGVNSAQSALSQVVGTWLMSKLQVHEPDEVFVLPSNPLLIQRLERFHQLQRRERRDRLRGAVTSESEGEDEEYDLEDDDDDDDDADSDYMSDGQGRIDRTQSDDANSTNPGSPLNSTQQQAVGVVQKSHLDDAQTGPQLVSESKQHRALQHSDSGDSGASVPRTADSKRCSIM